MGRIGIGWSGGGDIDHGTRSSEVYLFAECTGGRAMKTDTRLGTYEQVMQDVPADIRRIADTLRDNIHALHAEGTEVPCPGDRALSYGWGPKKMTEGYAYIMPHARHVNLGFYQGVALRDPHGLLEGTGKRLRHVKVRSVDDARRPEIRELLQQAIEERKAALGL